MEVNYELLQRGCITARENRLKQERIREATQERKAYGMERSRRRREQSKLKKEAA